MKIKPKYIRVASDLHLEQLVGTRIGHLIDQFIPADPRDSESILALAGDISSKPIQLLEFLHELNNSGRFLKIYFIPGNHEFYGHDMAGWTMNILANLGGYFEGEGTLEFPGCGVGYEELDGLRIIHATLWADGGATIAEEGAVGYCLNDFRVIKLGDKRFTVENMRVLHKAQKEKIEELLKMPFDGKTAVITHHMPSYQLCHPRFGGEINGGFASHSDNLLNDDHSPDVWIHGHTHDTTDHMLHGTRIVCNPSGYHREWGTQYTQFGPKFLSVETLGELEPVKPAFTPK